MKKLITLLLTTTLISACGWHLRGTVNSIDNVSSLHLGATQGRTELLDELSAEARRAGITLSASASAAEYSINLFNSTDEKRTVSLGTNALASEYELTMSVDYSIHKGQQILIAQETARSIRTYDFDTNQVLGKSREEELIREEMRSELINHILRRLQYMAATPAPAAAPDGPTAP